MIYFYKTLSFIGLLPNLLWKLIGLYIINRYLHLVQFSLLSRREKGGINLAQVAQEGDKAEARCQVFYLLVSLRLSASSTSRS